MSKRLKYTIYIPVVTRERHFLRSWYGHTSRWPTRRARQNDFIWLRLSLACAARVTPARASDVAALTPLALLRTGNQLWQSARSLMM